MDGPLRCREPVVGENRQKSEPFLITRESYVERDFLVERTGSTHYRAG